MLLGNLVLELELWGKGEIAGWILWVGGLLYLWGCVSLCRSARGCSTQYCICNPFVFNFEGHDAWRGVEVSISGGERVF